MLSNVINHRIPPAMDTSARLAVDLAMGIKTPAEVAQDYGLTPADLKLRLSKDKQLQHQVRELRQMWNDPTNVTERVRVKAGAMVEDALMDLWHMMTNPENHPGTRLDVHRHLSKLADVEPKRDATDAQGSRFSVIINLPGQSEPMRVVAEQTAALDAEHA